MECRIPRIVVAATKSGSGKTTIVTGLLAALRQQGIKVQPYKVGPDYIDPGYHRLASGRPSHNLDSWLMPREKMVEVFAASACGAELAVIEGVMGLYDGGNNGISSSAEIAKCLHAPVILVVDCKSMGASAAAVALGFKSFDKDVQLAGVILNRLGSDNHERIIREAMADLNIPVLGAVHRNDDLVMPERHLGLLPVEENQELKVVDDMGQAMARELDIAAIIKVGEGAAAINVPDGKIYENTLPKVRIGIARDDAFSFYYPESISVLEQQGAEVVYFSPLADRQLPRVDGLIFGGGFPEMFADKLSSNLELIESIRKEAAAGMPIYAECGGFMFLSSSMEAFNGEVFPMCDILPCRVKMNNKLQMVGYVSAELQTDTILGKKGDVLKGHEFHFSVELPREDNTEGKRAFEFVRARNGVHYPGGYVRGNVLGSYLHIHFAGYPDAASEFVEACRNFRGNKG
ncbi:MAG: cobyrinate a,c-diamide synthase [Anaerovibrio sp.]|uniref:cobyrinate a,c-diamide synthase n=1 Tax=Anaerovibrio sp. TaxID=1872532 RepID=UPI0025E35371|nr:cobyrinate a,c-diamide synthase [Anaerovibrio sp.]MCR5177250.1 cobyrinate a,c-diamide synthase [Anaerovibrio sp.]